MITCTERQRGCFHLCWFVSLSLSNIVCQQHNRMNAFSWDVMRRRASYMEQFWKFGRCYYSWYRVYFSMFSRKSVPVSNITVKWMNEFACFFFQNRLHMTQGKIQKRFIRIISLSTYNAHTEPWFKQLGILKINNLFDLNCLKFVYNFNKGELPRYFLGFKYEQRSSIHDHDTRFDNLIDSKPTRTVMAQNCIRHHIVSVELHPQMYSRQNWHPQSAGFYILYQAILSRPNDFWMQLKTMLYM